MNVEEKREARRRRILENSEVRLKKITSISSNQTQSILNEQSEFIKDTSENCTQKSELLYSPVPKCLIENVIPTVLEDQKVFNYEQNHFNPQLHSNDIKYEIKLQSITTLHVVLSQFVLVLFYYDLGFLFGNSIVVPFLLSAIPELYTSKEPHDNIHIIVLLMMGFSQNLARKISRYFKLASLTGKRFCVYIFCFTCSYAILTNLYFDVKHNSSIQ
ncbi:uncharacterized protein LOC100168712 [Acyrthosiphon pisum]|uniref:ACYPI009390 protein n=1 Tax=Acyrthosiphon pisum TaxID=7029 RepID=C4WW97_ACYPI|nr:uncharacterized protein LOC100168712 [Acyrthosiphon pisum]BAH72167.1 ACYPI009390 [Acyrthosiphon pisum]|eukprot:NP_001155796.1 uncharacterized protein LOC100168712 [Acyrthosiphon pisum]